MSISNLSKEYKVKKEKIIVYGVMFSIISLIIIGLMVKIGRESNEIISSYNNVNQLLYETESRNYKETMSICFMIFLGVTLMFHMYFFTKTKLIVNSKGIELYSIYSKKPSNAFYWNEIKSIQIGDVLMQGSKIPRYGMKIRHIKKSYSEHEQLKEFVPIRRFDNYLSLIEDLEGISEECNIDICHMDD